MMKKAQGLPLNTIVIAAIAVLVLVIVVLFFAGKFGDSNKALEDCSAKGGEFSSSASCSNGGVPTPTGSDNDAEKYCCIKIGS